jgi:two-component system response regulator MprA
VQQQTVLLVDDNDDAREALAFLIERYGIQVVQARNGRDALRQLEQGLRPGLILLDLMMPQLDGWAFRAEQRRLPGGEDVPVVIYSASPTVGDDAAQLQVAGWLQKPLDFDELLAMVRRYCVAA